MSMTANLTLLQGLETNIPDKLYVTHWPTGKVKYEVWLMDGHCGLACTSTTEAMIEVIATNAQYFPSHKTQQREFEEVDFDKARQIAKELARRSPGSKLDCLVFLENLDSPELHYIS